LLLVGVAVVVLILVDTPVEVVVELVDF